MRLTITKKHLDLGIKAVNKGSGTQTTNCILAQAAKEVLPNFVSCTNSYIHTKADAPNWRMVPIEEHKGLLRNLVNYFDDVQYDVVRNMLPVEIEFVGKSYETV